MADICKYMENICVILEKTIRWVSLEYTPPVWAAGLCRSRVNTRPYPLLELCFQSKGEHERLCVGSKCQRLPLNHLALITAHGGNYSSEPAGPVGMWYVSLDVSKALEFRQLAHAPLLHIIPIACPRRLVQAYEAVNARFGMTDPAKPLFLKAALLELLGVLQREVTGAHKGDAAALPLPVESALVFMQNNYMRPELMLDEIAVSAGLSMDHFGRIFYASMGITPMRYLKIIRITRARNLLGRTNLRIAEVARETGFDDPLYFSKVFHAEIGRSPRRYRRHPK